MILAVTPNPALDKTAVVPGFALGRTSRTADPLGLPGGKGFNFARSLRVLGADPLVVAPLAGHIGRMIYDLATAEGLRCDCLWIAGETRTCLTIVDPTTSIITELYEAGPVLAGADWGRFLLLIAARLPQAAFLAVSGGFMRGTPEDGLRDILVHARASGVPVLLDTYGPQLLRTLPYGPALVKINQFEAGDLLARQVSGPAEAIAAAAAIRARGATAVVITLGAQGAAGVDARGAAFAWQAPGVQGVSPIGSGDAFFAGIAAGLARGLSLAAAARDGIAAGAANTLRLGAGVFDPEQVAALREQVKPLPLDTA